MHPPPFRMDHALSDWPDCRLEVRCSCGAISILPVKWLREHYGDPTFGAVLGRLRCQRCRKTPAPVYLLADEHREFEGGADPGWAVEIVPRRTSQEH